MGGDHNRGGKNAEIDCFNPRPRVGGDSAFHPLLFCPVRFQSTPPRGGRLWSGVMAKLSNLFQSTPPRGGRLETAATPDTDYRFQSTPPRGGRRFSDLARQNQTCFNPRPRVGGDALQDCACGQALIVSIHAPAWGATPGNRLGPFCPAVSIHAPAWGATDSMDFLWRPSRVSIHAPAWGATTAVMMMVFLLITDFRNHFRT